MKLILVVFMTACASYLAAQEPPSDQQAEIELLKKEIVLLNQNMENIQLNLGKSENKFKRGIAIATIGYSVTIAGGLMLGRENDDLGKILLVTGGAVGITGTIMMVDAFKYLGRASRKQK